MIAEFTVYMKVYNSSINIFYPIFGLEFSIFIFNLYTTISFHVSNKMFYFRFMQVQTPKI